MLHTSAPARPGVVVPVLDDPGMERVPILDLSSGYVQRGIARFPRAGTRGPWTMAMAYEKDVARLREGPVQDAALRFATSRPDELASGWFRAVIAGTEMSLTLLPGTG
jgi:hypothetical protein